MQTNGSARPFTFRIENISPGTTAEDQPNIQVRSLVPAVDNYEQDVQEYTATVQFQSLDPTVLSPRVLDDDEISVDNDFHGFTPLNHPEEPIAADIIAVTGLAAHAYGSWAHSARNMWLRDYLPRDIKNVRVMIYGYPSQLQGNTSRSILSDYSTNLINRLLTMRESAKCQDRPIVFIGHSLGCLIIKKVLCDINGSINIYSSRLPVRALIFLGAPHKGLEIEALHTLVEGQASEDIVRELKAESPTLTELNDKFRHVAKDIDILTCYETIPTKTAIRMPDGIWKREGPAEMMVSLNSAGQWLPREKLVACNADHTQIAKLKRGESGVYPSIRSAIRKAMLSAGDLYSEAKSKPSETETMEAPQSSSSDGHDAQHLSSMSPISVKKAGVQSQSEHGLDSSFPSSPLDLADIAHESGDAGPFSQFLNQSTFAWQRHTQDHGARDLHLPSSPSISTGTEAASDTFDTPFPIAGNVESATSFGTDVKESSGSPEFSSRSLEFHELVLQDAIPTPQDLPQEETGNDAKSEQGSKDPSGQRMTVSKIPVKESALAKEQKVNDSDSKGKAVDAIEDDELTRAIKEGDIDKTRKLLQSHYPVERRGRSDDGATPLLIAVKYRQQHIVHFLLDRGASTTARNNNGSTTLHLLAAPNDSEKDGEEYLADEGLIDILLESRPPLDVANKSKRTPLMHAISSGQEKLAKRLIDYGADVTAVDEKGRNVLHLVAITGHCLNLVKLLSKDGGLINSKATERQLTPLNLAVSVEFRAEIIVQLVEAGADTDAGDVDGWTPLHKAAGLNESACVAQLLNLGADVESRSNTGETPLHVAAIYCKGSTDVVEHLLRAGANLEAPNQWGGMPLTSAVLGNNDICVIHFLERGANIEHRGRFHETALEKASRKGYLDIVKLLLEHGANIEHRDKNHETALEKASREGDLDIVKLLLEHGANMEHRDKTYKYALELASREGSLDMVKLLLEHGANIEYRNGYNENALEIASKRGSLDTVKFLLEHGANPCASTLDLCKPKFRRTARSMCGDHKEIKDILKAAEKAWKASGKKRFLTAFLLSLHAGKARA